MGTHGTGVPVNGIDNQGWKLYIVSVVMIVASGMFVVARVASRIWFYKLGADDVTIVISLLFSIVVSVCMILAIQNGYGMHKADLDKAELRTALKLFFIAQTPYKVTVCLNKVSAILLYLRIFISTPFRIAAFVVMGIIVAWSIGAVGATIGQCVPIAGAWNKALDAKCIDSDSFWVAYAVANIITDAMVLALPIPPILQLKLKLRERLMLCCVFLVGGFTTIASILRTTSVHNSLKNKGDTTYNFIPRGMWTLIEANLGIISACLPVLKHPLGRLFPRIFGSTKHSYLEHNGNPIGRPSGYSLSNMSNGRRDNASGNRNYSNNHSHHDNNDINRQNPVLHPPTAASVSVSVSANHMRRKSDEWPIITESSVKETDSDPGSDRGTGIAKRVDIHMVG